MTSLLWRYVEWRLRRRLPVDAVAPALGDLAEDYERRRRSSGWIPSAMWLLAEARSLAGTYRHAITRGRSGTPWLRDLSQDARYALRMFRHTPGLTVVALLTLALGTGTATVMFTVINSVLLKPLPYVDPDRLVRVNGQSDPAGDGPQNIAYPDFRDCQTQSRTMELAGWLWDTATITAPGDPEFLRHVSVSANLFSLLGVRIEQGRDFVVDDDRAGAAGVAIVSDALSRRRFGGTTPVGTTIVLDTKTYTIIGVAPANFRPDDGIDVYTPLGQNGLPFLAQRRPHPIQVTGRLRAGATLAQAQTELRGIAAALAASYTATNQGRTFTVIPLQPAVGNVSGTLWLLFAAVVVVLVLACVNIANLLLARQLARQREMALRVALGAGRGRLIRQCLTESLMLAVIGGTLGVGLAAIGLQPFVATWPGGLPRASTIALDGRVLLFALAMSLASGLAFGLAPAFGAQTRDVERTLRAGGRTIGAASRRLQGVFVIVEVGLAMVLLASASLLGRTLLRVSSLDPGLDVHNVLTTRAAISPAALGDPAAARDAWRSLLENARRVPGVSAVTMLDTVPLRSGNNQIAIRLTPAPLRGTDGPTALASSVTPEYLGVTGIPLRAGRFFTEADRLGAQSVAVIDDVMAEQVFGGRNPIGQSLWIDLGNDPATIIGVVGHVRYWGLASDDQSAVRSQIYYPFAQVPDALIRRWSQLMSIAVRTSVEPAAVIEPLRRAVAGDARDQVLYQMQTLEELASASIAPQRFLLWLFGIFSAMALTLACIGVYGVLAHLTSQRVPEMAVRMALGSSASGVRWLVLRQSLGLVAVGILIGMAGTMVSDRVLSRLVDGALPAGLSSIAVATPVLVFAALVASVVPARRASRVDPAAVLK